MDDPIELYTTASSSHGEAAHGDLEWWGVGFAEYAAEKDSEAHERMLDLIGVTRTVPVMVVEEGKPPRMGWSCTV